MPGSFRCRAKGVLSHPVDASPNLSGCYGRLPPMGYRGKVVERQQARRLRRAGLPLDEIAAQVGVSKSSVSLWVRDVELDVPVIRSARVAAGPECAAAAQAGGDRAAP